MHLGDSIEKGAGRKWYETLPWKNRQDFSKQRLRERGRSRGMHTQAWARGGTGYEHYATGRLRENSGKSPKKEVQ